MTEPGLCGRLSSFTIVYNYSDRIKETLLVQPQVPSITMLQRLKLTHKMLILVAVPLLVELGLFCWLNYLLEETEKEREREYVARAIISHINEVHRYLIDSVTASAGFGTQYSPAERRERSRSIAANMERQERNLDKLLVDKSEAREHFLRAKQIVKDGAEKLSALKRMFRHEGLLAVRDEVREIFGQLSDELDTILEEERKAEELSPKRQKEFNDRIQMVLLIGVVLNTVMAIGLMLFLSRNLTGRISLLMDNSIRLARGLPLNPPLAGDDEISHLDGVFREMASALSIAAMKERAVVENAADMIFSINGAGCFTKVSPASQKVLGWEPDDLLGKQYLDFVFEEDRENTVSALVSSKTASAAFETRLVRQDESIVSTLWSVTWSEDDDSFFCVAHDITERKQSEDMARMAEARVRQILQNLPIGVVIITRKGFVEYFNRTCEEMLCIRPQDVLGKHFNNFLNMKEAGKLPKDIIDLALNHSFECLVKTEMRDDLPIEISFRKIETIDGQRLLGLILDVTERHEIERLKQDFVSMVSHDLRTPLTSVAGYLELLGDGIYGKLNEPGMERLESLTRSIDRLVKLVCDLLDLDRLESGAMKLRMHKVNLASLFEQTASACEAVRNEKKVELVLPTAETKVNVDGDRIVQVLVNLVSNAIKFSPEGGKVTVSVEPVNASLKFQVTDQGCGIAPEFQRSIFERFKQAPEGEINRMGTGLGLAISRAIVEQHGGKIGVVSQEGKGSTFWFSVPHPDS